MIRVAVAGAAGRMGRMVCDAVSATGDLTVTGRADPVLGTSVEDVLDDADSNGAEPARPDVAGSAVNGGTQQPAPVGKGWV